MKYNVKKIAFLVGVLIVLVSHIQMWMKPMDSEKQKMHAMLNLVALALIVFGAKRKLKKN